jgi:GPH family glycoside/pentoside/hexuronide:cation symporter
MYKEVVPMANGINKLSAWVKVKFGVADFGLSMLTSVLQFYMVFYYTDIVKINPAIAGTAILVGKLTWDMANDVLCGYVSDRTKSRWGRRRPYLIFCSIPLFLSFWLLMSLPQGMGNIAAFFAIIGTFLLFDTFHTMISMSYYAMTAELTLNYDERTSITTFRMVFCALGYIGGATLTTLIVSILRESGGISESAAWSRVGFLFGLVAAVTALFTGLFVRQKPVIQQEPTKIPPLQAIFSTLKNKPFVKYITIQAIMAIAFTMVTAMLPYFIKYQLDMGSQEFIIMGVLLLMITFFLVPCRIVCNRIGKAKTYALGLSIAGTALIVSFFLPYGPTVIIYGIAVVAGIGFSSQWVCPHSMVPDVIEYDELASGERREGLFYGMNAMMTKVPGALGSAMVGWSLALFGYVENASQTTTALFGIRLAFALVPAVLLLICLPLLINYPITRESHAQVVRELEIMREKRDHNKS